MHTTYNADIYLETTPEVMGNKKAAVVIDLSGKKEMTMNEILDKVLNAEFPNVIVRGQKLNDNSEIKPLLKALSLKRFVTFQTTADDSIDAVRHIRGTRFIVETEEALSRYVKNLRKLGSRDILSISVDSIKSFETFANELVNLKFAPEVVFKFSKKVTSVKAFKSWMAFEKTSPRWLSTAIAFESAAVDMDSEDKKEPEESKPVVKEEQVVKTEETQPVDPAKTEPQVA